MLGTTILGNPHMMQLEGLINGIQPEHNQGSDNVMYREKHISLSRFFFEKNVVTSK